MWDAAFKQEGRSQVCERGSLFVIFGDFITLKVCSCNISSIVRFHVKRRDEEHSGYYVFTKNGDRPDRPTSSSKAELEGG